MEGLSIFPKAHPSKDESSRKGSLSGKPVCSLSKSVICAGVVLVIVGIVCHILKTTHGMNLTSIGGAAITAGLVFFITGVIAYYSPLSSSGLIKSRLPPSSAKKLTSFSPSPLPAKEFFTSKGIFGLPQGLLDELDIWKKYRTDCRFSTIYPNFSFGAGILLHGPTGTGKTTIAQAIGEFLGGKYVGIACGDLLSTLHGGTEQAITELFTVPEGEFRVIMIDEIEALIPDRVAGMFNPLAQKHTSHFLATVPGTRQPKPRYMLVGTTNMMNAIDSAVLREGRLGAQFEISFPETNAYTLMFQHHLSQLNLSREDDWEDFAELLANRMPYRSSGASVIACVNNAQRQCILENRVTVQRKDFFPNEGNRDLRL